MIKVPISDNYVMPGFQTVNKNQQQTQLILMDPQNTSLYLLHQYYCTDSQDYSQLIALLQTQATQGVQSPYVLNPVVYLPIKYTNEQFQTSHFVQVLYEYGSHTLEQQLYLRTQEKNYFEEHQIWSILGSCILGLKNLKDKQFTHSSICMNDIFVTKQGQIKICHPMFRTYDHTNSQQVEQNYFQRAICQNYYFAPQQLPYHQKQLSYHRQHPQQSKKSQQNQQSKHYQSQQSQFYQVSLDQMFKSDIFSSGMIVISLCLLHPINDCYIKRGTRHEYEIYIQSERLTQYFNALEQMYTPDLVGILFSMVAYNSEERMSIDELALIIEQMIEAKQFEEDNQGQQAQSTECINAKNYEEDAKGSVIRKNNNLNVENIMNSEERFGKFSRVSQASPLSGRKTSKYTHVYGGRLQESHPDPQDKPSIVSVQCQNDYPNIDVDESNNLNQSQASINCPMNQTMKEQTHDQELLGTQQNIQKPQVVQQGQQILQSFNQTLRQYINHQNSSSILQVNQTKTYQQNQTKNIQNPNPFSPQHVHSVMTSKQLSSLPSDSTSFVVEKHTFHKQNQFNYGNTFNNPQFVLSKHISSQRKQMPSQRKQMPSQRKQMPSQRKQMSSQRKQMPSQRKQMPSQRKQMPSQRKDFPKQMSNQPIHQQKKNPQIKSRSPNNLKQFLNTIKQHNSQKPQTYQLMNQSPQNYISSARTYSEQTKQNHYFGANQSTNNQLITFDKNTSNNYMESSVKSLLNISLNKQYENFLQIQNKNPSSLYTDPKFLQAIREDVNKILKKRKLKLTSTETSQNIQQPSPKQIYINGRKADDKKPQPMGFITPISYISRPFNNTISQFR